MTAQERTACATLAALLRACGPLALWSLALSTLAAAALALAGREPGTAAALGWGATLLLGLPERYLAVRLRFDERLFEGLAQGRVDTLASLDAALARLGLRSASAAGRSLDERIHGTRRWMFRHAAVVAGQTACFVLALLAQRIA